LVVVQMYGEGDLYGQAIGGGLEGPGIGRVLVDELFDQALLVGTDDAHPRRHVDDDDDGKDDQ